MRVRVDPDADPADTDRLEFRESSRILGADEDVDRLGATAPITALMEAMSGRFGA